MSFSLAIRRLRRTPGITLASVLCLALGIGSTVATTSLLDAALFRPLPVAEPDRLMTVYAGRPGNPYRTSNYADVVDLDRMTRQVTEGVVAAVSTELALLGVGEPRLVEGGLVSARYFDVLGVTPVLGSTDVFAESATGDATGVVLGHALWQRLFAADPEVLGRELRLHGHSYRVVAVAPPRFAGHALDETVEVWLPLAAYPRVATGFLATFDAVDYEAQRHGRRISMWETLTRLRPGVTRERAEVVFEGAGRTLADRFPDTNAEVRFTLVPAVEAALPMTSRDDAVRFLGLLAAAVGLALLLAIGSVAILQLARTRRRRDETAIRLALGAPRSRIARDLLGESVILALAGGAGGILLASWLLDLVSSYELPGGVALGQLETRLDPRVLAIAVVAALLAAVLSSLAPAFAGLRTGPAAVLRRERTHTGHQRWRLLLVAGQVAITVVLLTGLGLLGRTLFEAWSADLGFDAEGVLTVSVDLGPREVGAEGAERFFTELRREAEALPGVVSTALTAVAFGDEGLSVGSVRTSDGRAFDDVDIPLTRVSRGYFETMGIELREGRDFRAGDENVVVVNDRLAKRLWPGERPIGHGLNFAGPDRPFMEIVGMAETSRYWSLDDESDYVYLPLEESWDAAAGGEMTLLARAAGDPLLLAEPIATILRGLDPDLPVSSVTTLEGRIDELLLPQRMAAGVLGFFGLLALLLAVLGVAGVVAFAVHARRREMGIRLALGARPAELVQDLVRRGLVPVVAGALVGAVLAAVGTRLLTGLLYGVAPLDLPTFVAVPTLLLIAATAAALVPARRAGTVDPASVLREE